MNKFIKKIFFLILTLVLLVACTNKASKNTSEMDKAIEQAIEDVKNEDENKNSKPLDEKEDKSFDFRHDSYSLITFAHAENIIVERIKWCDDENKDKNGKRDEKKIIKI